MRSFGIFLLLCGLALMVGAFFFPVVTDAEDVARLIRESSSGVAQSPVANLDRIALRTMLEIAGAATTVVGSVLAAVGNLQAGMNRSTPSS